MLDDLDVGFILCIIMKNYDFKKARKILKNELGKGVKEASLGMYEDWFWTAESIYRDGKNVRLRKAGKIGGIEGSYWATPTLCIEYSDGDRKMFPCFIGENDEKVAQQKKQTFGTEALGCLSAPVQNDLPELLDYNS